MEARSVTLHIDLRDARPSVTRDVLLPWDAPLPLVSSVIQQVMGWEGYHLHGFTRGGEFWGAAPRWTADPRDGDEASEQDASLRTLLPTQDAVATYVYDYGDSWELRLTITETHEEDCADPRILAATGGHVLEECGGTPGYAALVEAAQAATDQRPLTEDQAQLLEWALEVSGLEGTSALHEWLTRFDTAEARARLAALPAPDPPEADGSPEGSPDDSPKDDRPTDTAPGRAEDGSPVGDHPTDPAPPEAEGSPEGSPVGDHPLVVRLPPGVVRDSLRRAFLTAVRRQPTPLAQMVLDARLEDTEALTPEDCAELTGGLRRYLEHVGDGLSLTASGYLRPADALALAAALGLDDDYLGRLRREADTRALLVICHALTRMRILRRTKERLTVTEAARTALSDPQALLDLVVSRLPVERQDMDRLIALTTVLDLAGQPVQERGVQEPDPADYHEQHRRRNARLAAAVVSLGITTTARPLTGWDVMRVAEETQMVLWVCRVFPGDLFRTAWAPTPLGRVLLLRVLNAPDGP
ncbi:plasmid pRiA4b ORF-3 family protein [uncultured Actinomyces sp.]|uniref:plasmid pRiA4b ORF-3 family protein n=1 Tax=uncultured Actinomyces sp. TaxID=249061 RepID=UPI0028DB6439|nr:plasmid pRiA4b ORF-3 family protein [uncultured Actinomyces sp.]